MTKGIDVSSHQGVVDFRKVKAAGLNGWGKQDKPAEPPVKPIEPPEADTVSFTREQWSALFDTLTRVQEG